MDNTEEDKEKKSKGSKKDKRELGQEEVAKDGVYLPLTAQVVREELARLD